MIRIGGCVWWRGNRYGGRGARGGRSRGDSLASPATTSWRAWSFFHDLTMRRRFLHSLHRGGDRQLNRAIHINALGRMAWDPPNPRLHPATGLRWQDQREALRCLKRHIARQIWHLLYNLQPTTPESIGGRSTRVTVGAPGLMPCAR
jgi:hypothetical protein